jgi:hypothetical protein
MENPMTTIPQPTTADVLSGILDSIRRGEVSPEECASFRHVAGEISAHGAICAEAIQRREARQKPRPANAAVDARRK